MPQILLYEVFSVRKDEDTPGLDKSCTMEQAIETPIPAIPAIV